jgi:hypothetical protein
MPSLPTTKLASIKLGMATGQKIAIFHQATEESDKVVLYKAFPKELVVAFSGYVATALNAVPLSQIPLSEMLKPKSETEVVITGGRSESLVEVLEWILACGKAGKTVAFRNIQSPSFYYYGTVLLASQKLQVNVLEAQLKARMKEITALQVHSIDVERVFSSISGPHIFKDMICESIGQAMFNDTLKAFSAYKALFKMEEYREFKDGVDEAYGRLEKQYFKTPEGKAAKAAKKEQEEKAHKAEEKREASKLRREQNFKQAAAKRHNVNPSSIQPTGKGHYTLSTEGRTVRRGHGGRPGFVQLDLGTFGVAPGQFRTSNAPAPPRKSNKSAPTPAKASTIPKTEATALSTANPVADNKVESAAAGVPSDEKLIEGIEKMDLTKE